MPLYGPYEVGYGTRVTGTQTGAITIGAAAGWSALIGVFVGSVGNGTAPMVQVWQGQSTGAGLTIIGQFTAPRSAFTRLPALCSGGATFYVSNCELPDLTIYWAPIS